MPLFKRAIEIDPKFAMAYGMLGTRVRRNWESLTSRRRAPPRPINCGIAPVNAEKFFITATYDRQVTGNLEKAAADL